MSQDDQNSGQKPRSGLHADGSGGGPANRSTPPEPLSRQRIIDVAVTFIDEHGLPGLSMRRLGEILGFEAMSLYRHVNGRDDLLDAVVEQIMAGMTADPEVITHPEHGWQDFLQRIAHGVRGIALAHPKAFPLVVSRPTPAPWLRPPLRSLTWVEAFLAGLKEEDFSDTGAVEAYRAFTSFLLGHLLLEVAAHGADLGPLDVLEDEPERSLDLYPTVKSLQDALREDHSRAEFDASLENLLERIALIRSET